MFFSTLHVFGSMLCTLKPVKATTSNGVPKVTFPDKVFPTKRCAELIQKYTDKCYGNKHLWMSVVLCKTHNNDITERRLFWDDNWHVVHFSCFGPHIWNSLPQDLGRCSTLSSYKAKLKAFFFSQYFSSQLISVASFCYSHCVCVCVCVCV